MRARLSTLIAAALTGLLGPAVLPAAAEDSAATSEAPAASAGATSPQTTETTTPTTATGSTTPTAAAGSTEAAQSSNNGPAQGPSNVQPSNEPSTGGPNQESGASAGSTIGNDATVGQSSGQAQDAGTAGAGGSAGVGSTSGSGVSQGAQQAETGQQATAGAQAAAENPQNESNGVRVGEAQSGNGNGVGQQATSDAQATATTGQSTTQDPGNGSSHASGNQSASANAHAGADRPSNTNVNARIEAHGNDAAFGQSIASNARAEAANARTGEDIAQEARAAATAELQQPENTAVEVRLFSDGDTAGGIQTIAATAAALVANGGANASANATSVLTNPANTFVSVRVNSDGTTGDVEQEILRRELEVVDGESIEQAVRDLLDSIWSSFDLADGVSISLAADGANTDLRITIENDSLVRPSAGMSFFWTWDLVFGAGGALDCAIASSLAGTEVRWNFDCDPTNRLQETSTAPASAPAPTAGAISWSWDWDRPGLADWSWQRNDVIPIPTCGLCAYMFDFDWLSFEPHTPASVPVPTLAPPSLTAPFGVTQVNAVSAAATASATSRIDQLLSQSRGGTAEGTQQALQQAQVVQAAEAQAGAQLTDAVNYSVDTGGVVAQTNLAESEAAAAVTATTLQEAAQQLVGNDSLQTQLLLQSATTTQQLFAAGNATLGRSANVGVSIGGTSTQTASSIVSARGVEVATTRQTVEQEQDGNESDQEQIAGQWAVVAQQLELLAAAALSDTRNESSLRAEASTLQLESEATVTGSSASTIDQVAIQLQSGDTTALQQESLQQATVEQSTVGLAAATAGGYKLIYRTPPPPIVTVIAPVTAVTVPVAIAAPAIETAAQGEPVFLSLPLLTAGPVVKPVRAVSPKGATPVTFVAPRASAPTVQERPAVTTTTVESASERAAAAPAPLAIPFATEILASPAGTAGPVTSKAGDAEKAQEGPVGPPECLTPASGGSAATAGTGSGNAFCALSGYVLSPVPRLGRRQFEPAGRRPAADVLLRARPG